MSYGSETLLASLDRRVVVVTRPAHQADNLCQLIENRGATVIRFPVIEIRGPSNSSNLNNIISRLKDFDIAIFISANAVEYGIKAISAAGSLPTTIKLAAVGQATSKKLADLVRPADIVPVSKFNSEALLELDTMHSVEGKRIVIFRGEGGRELLASTLRQRGAKVEYAECYSRVRPQLAADELQISWMENRLDIIIITSNEALQNLYDMVGEKNHKFLLNTPLLLVSQRAVDFARKLGFNEALIVADAASDDALVKALEQWQLKLL